MNDIVKYVYIYIYTHIYISLSLSLSLNMTPSTDCYRVGEVPHLWSATQVRNSVYAGGLSKKAIRFHESNKSQERYHSLNSFKGLYRGLFGGVVKEVLRGMDTRSLDLSSYGLLLKVSVLFEYPYSHSTEYVGYTSILETNRMPWHGSPFLPGNARPSYSTSPQCGLASS